MRHLLEISDLTREDFFRIIDRGIEHRGNRSLAQKFLDQKTIALLFEKASTRTRLSFTVAAQELGGNVLSLEADMLQLGRGESIEDTAEVFSRYMHAIMIRSRSHENVRTMAAMNRIPVINGLTELHHPCQTLADYMTLKQYGYDILKGNFIIAFVGEGNNVFNSLAAASVFSGSEVRIASPEGYGISPEIRDFLSRNHVTVKEFKEPSDAVRGANVIYTDVWVSMGQEEEVKERKKIFSPYCIDENLLAHADPQHIVMHCLPAHRGEEITATVMEKYSRYIFDQAENRMHVQKAVLEWIFEAL
ncbi:MAG: ornithine carbamoyltransferase [Spirochaetia bacterium]|nr:ornithine carbamoyltransferase [Spirochaetia bacterium]